VRKHPKYDLRLGYQTRGLASLALALLLANAVVQLWPSGFTPFGEGVTFRVRAQETIQIDDVQPTRQRLGTPPPPPPLTPLVLPDDRVIEDYTLEMPAELAVIDAPPGDESPSDGAAAATGAAPSVEARPVRIVEPEYSRKARDRKIRAEVVVEVLVNERGAVSKATVTGRFLLGDEDEAPRPVEIIGYGIEESAIAAARKWVFRPARDRGKAVPSYTTLTFSFGI
jgi:protein TonB